MKYFIDTEFIEGFHKSLFGKRRHFIDLISIGIVDEDGREYYAISNEYDYNKASPWVKDNVILPMFRELPTFKKEHMEPDNFHKAVGKSNKQIVHEIVEFICPYEIASVWAGSGPISSGMEAFLEKHPPEFYGYYADYDWVLFCSLFGTMMDLPKGFPMYCRDLKQTLDEKEMNQKEKYSDKTRLQAWLENVKQHPNYPKQTNEHNALADARWNYELYKFLQTI